MWKVGGIKIERTQAQNFFLQTDKEISEKGNFFVNRSITKKFQRQIFRYGDYRTATDSAFRISVWKGGTNFFWPCLGRLKSVEGKKMWSVSKKRRCQRKCISHNFQNWACPLKSLFPVGYGKKWLKWASSIFKILGDTFFLHPNFHFIFF